MTSDGTESPDGKSDDATVRELATFALALVVCVIVFFVIGLNKVYLLAHLPPRPRRIVRVSR